MAMEKNTRKNCAFILALAALAACITLSIALCAPEPAAPSAPVSAGEYHIGPENVLQIDVSYGKEEKISQKVRVSSLGMITFPLLGEVKIISMTIGELEKELTDLLERDYLVNPRVTVFIEEYSTVSILGQVTKPGSYPIKGSLTVLELISLAEGFTKIAAPNNTKVIRTLDDGKKQEIKVRANDIINNPRSGENVELKAGDVIVVPESAF